MRRKSLGFANTDVFTLAVLFAAGVMIVGRIFNIFVCEQDYYRGHPLAALNWSQGGAVSHGLLLCGLIATAAFARVKGRPLIALLS